jgi:hypothetical protein
LNVLERIYRPSCEPLYATNTFHRKQETFLYVLCIQSFCPQKTHNRTLLFCVTLLKHGRHFEYWNHPLNMCVCYSDCHEAGLCCYLVIQKTYYIHYSCFTAIFCLFTYSPSYD